MEKIAVLLTTYNRKAMTINCIRTIAEGNKSLSLEFIVVVDGCNDGTELALKELPYAIVILSGNGELYWNGGMRLGMQYIIDAIDQYSHILWVNDDVKFYDNIIEDMYQEMLKKGSWVLVGNTCDGNEKVSYGAIQYKSRRSLNYHIVNLMETEVQIDTFNGNCVLFKKECILRFGNLDPKYCHSMGDFDYGLMISRAGYIIDLYHRCVGICEDNSIEKTWKDYTLSRRDRIQLKESAKGLPYKEWFHFLNKHYGFFYALFYSLTPYIRILIRK